MQDSGSHVSVEETGPNDTVKVDFLAESPEQLEPYCQFCELLRSCQRSHVPQCPGEEPDYLALIKKKIRQKQTFTMLRVA